MSSRGVILPRGVVELRVAGSESGAAGGKSGERTSPVLRGVDLKELQAKAFERGRAVEREEVAGLLLAAAQDLTAAAAELRAARASDREELESFAVRLSSVIAEAFIGISVEKSHHDVRGLAKKVLDQVLPDFSGGELILEAHPEDLALLPADFVTMRGGSGLALVADPSLPRASFRVQSEGAQFYSGVSDRLELARTALLEEIARAHHA